MKLKCFLVFLFFSLFFQCVELIGQEQAANPEQQGNYRSVKGVVKDSNGEPLSGVTIRLKGILVGTQTNIDGNFELPIPDGLYEPVATFSYVGMNTKEVKITDRRKVLSIVLMENTALQEVVVTGVFTKAKESFTGAASMLTKKDLDMAGSRSILTSIRNLDPSFNIAQNLSAGSDPNSMPNITMRGSTSLPVNVQDMQIDQDALRKANQPLFIMNGFEISLERFLDVDENLVESVTLLKDANATALYGTRGSNGVVVLTTKRPEPGTLQITYKGQLNLEVPDLGSYDLMNSKEKLSYEKAAGLYTGNPSSITASNQVALDELYNLRRRQAESGVDTYWIKYPVRTGVGQKHSVNISGGDDNMLYGGGVSYNGIEGVMKGSSRRTISGNVQLLYKLDNVSFQNDLIISSTKAKVSPYGSFDIYTKVNSYYTPFDERGNLISVFEKERSYIQLDYKNSQTVTNPLFDAALPSKNDDEYLEITNNFALEWYIKPELFFRGQIGITSNRTRFDKYVPIGHSDFMNYTEADNDRKGKYTYRTGNSFTYSIKPTLNYTKTFNGRHQLYANIGYTVEEEKYERYTIVAEGISAPTMDFLGMANQYEKDGKPMATEGITRSVGLVGSANYTYDRRYFVDVNGKYEGSSQFGSSRRFAPIWSAGAGWNIHQEKFLQEHKIIDVARIRLSYGITGSQNFQPYMSLISYRDYASSGYLGWYGMKLLQLGNSDLGWQKTKQFNVGGELEFLKRRFKIEFDAFNKITDGLIADVSLPSSSGFVSYTANVGKVQNRGFELSTNAYIITNSERKGFTWNVGFKMIYNKNTLKKISSGLDVLNEGLEGANTRNPSFLYREGESMNTIFAVRSKGIDPSNGREVFIKLDGTETYNWDAKDQVACGEKIPPYLGNINTTLRYNGFSLVAYFNYHFGGQMYNTTLANKVENIFPYDNADRRAFTDRWQKPGDISKFKAASDLSTTYATTRFVMDDNLFTCGSLTLGYDIPMEWSRKHLYAKSVTLRANCEELFTLASIKVERGTLFPFARKFSLTVSATF